MAEILLEQEEKEMMEKLRKINEHIQFLDV